MHPRVGTTIGDYELSASLGGGPFGHVFLAKHRGRDSTCAVKVFDVHRCSAATLRYSAELTTAAAAIPGAHACPIYDAVIDAPDPFFVLELAAGESLESLRRRSSRLGWQQARAVFSRIAASLVAAHRAGIAHGNLKPANIRVVAGGAATSVRLLDWGLGQARHAAADGNTRADLNLAVDYLAPELLSGAPASPAADLYALGVVLFEAVTGQRPFQGAPNVVAMHHMRTPSPSPLLAAPELPPEAASLISRLLEKDPSRRLASAIELYDRLRVTAEQPVPTAPITALDVEPATEVFQRRVHAEPHTEPAVSTTVVTTQRIHANQRSAETVILAAPTPLEHQEPGAVTLILESTQGQFLLDTDPKLAVPHHPREQTSVAVNPSATVFVKQLSPSMLRPPPAAQPPRSAPDSPLRRWLRGPWSLERKLITLNVLLVCVILFGVFATLGK